MNLTKLLTGQQADHIHWLNQHIGIHQAMLPHWQALQVAAKTAGFDLQIASGFRSFDRQLTIWNNKYNQKSSVKDQQNNELDLSLFSTDERIKAILLFSALPGASRHHWGTDIDVFAANLLPKNQPLQLEPWEYQAAGPFAELTLWLTTHCQQYGFYQPYDLDRGGVAIEPWHISYAPLAQHYQKALTIELLSATITNANIMGKIDILKQLTNIYQQYIINVCEIPSLGENFG